MSDRPPLKQSPLSGSGCRFPSAKQCVRERFFAVKRYFTVVAIQCFDDCYTRFSGCAVAKDTPFWNDISAAGAQRTSEFFELSNKRTRADQIDIRVMPMHAQTTISVDYASPKVGVELQAFIGGAGGVRFITRNTISRQVRNHWLRAKRYLTAFVLTIVSSVYRARKPDELLQFFNMRNVACRKMQSDFVSSPDVAICHKEAYPVGTRWSDFRKSKSIDCMNTPYRRRGSHLYASGSDNAFNGTRGSLEFGGKLPKTLPREILLTDFVFDNRGKIGHWQFSLHGVSR